MSLISLWSLGSRPGVVDVHRDHRRRRVTADVAHEREVEVVRVPLALRPGRIPDLRRACLAAHLVVPDERTLGVPGHRGRDVMRGCPAAGCATFLVSTRVPGGARPAYVPPMATRKCGWTCMPAVDHGRERGGQLDGRRHHALAEGAVGQVDGRPRLRVVDRRAMPAHLARHVHAGPHPDAQLLPRLVQVRGSARRWSGPAGRRPARRPRCGRRR